jgi:hypothetical protein
MEPDQDTTALVLEIQHAAEALTLLRTELVALGREDELRLAEAEYDALEEDVLPKTNL